MAVEEGSAHPKPRHLPTPGGLSKGIGELAKWAKRNWARLTLSTIGVGSLGTGIWEWNQLQQKPVVPKEDKISTPPSFAPGAGNERVVPIETVTPTATATPGSTETPPPTATVPATATAAPVLKPSSEKRFPSGLIEKYGMVTEKNFDKYFSRISQEEFQKLLKEQPDLPLFPFVPLSDQFSIGETVSTDSLNGQTYTHIEIYAPHLLIVAGIDGKLDLIKQGGTNFAGLGIIQDLSDKIKIQYQNTVLGANSKFKPTIDAPVWINNDTRDGVPVKKGQLVAEFFGSDAFDNGRYSGPENQISLIIARLEKLDVPVKIGPGNLTMTAKTTYLTSSLSNPQGWVHTADGRIAIKKP